MTSCHSIRPLLPARADELTVFEARTRAEHVAGCARCATESAAYSRLGQALSTMANLEVDPADGTLERVLVAIGRRRTGVTDPRVLAAAGSAGALVATVVVRVPQSYLFDVTIPGNLGALVIMTTALLLGRRPTLPPAYVLYLGAFYVLTPGSHGLRGLESWIGGDKIQG
jgi:anti-sigma factor RsiW